MSQAYTQQFKREEALSKQLRLCDTINESLLDLMMQVWKLSVHYVILFIGNELKQKAKMKLKRHLKETDKLSVS